MNYDEAVGYLYSLQHHGIKLGLDNPKTLLAALGNPHDSFRGIHVAGTNGKGSTSAALACVMEAHGQRSGLFTSPHILSFTERIRVNGREIAEDCVVRLTGMIAEAIREKTPELNPTFFEFVTAIGFLYFKEMGVQWAAVETGMGGRLDATNVIRPEVSAVTPVGLDHKEFLGNTLEEIAREKAGIIKPGVPVVLAPQTPEALRVLEETALGNSCALYIHGRDFYSVLKEISSEGIVFDYEGPGGLRLKNLFFPLTGRYQAVNASVAVTAAACAGFDDGEKIRQGLREVRLPGRLEVISAGPPRILLDGAHNPEAACALAAALREIFGNGQRLILIAGIMGDKDIGGILAELLPLASEAIFCAPSYGRAARPEELQARAEAMGFAGGKTARSVSEAVQTASGLASSEDIILVTGSFYTAGEAKEAIQGGGRLARLRE